jgi:hypothetical protein
LQSYDIGTELEINGTRAFIRLQTRDARDSVDHILHNFLKQDYMNFPENKISAIAVGVRKDIALRR